MKPRSVVPMRIAKIGYVVISLIFCLAGIFMILLPDSLMQITGAFFGAAMIVFGIIKCIGYFSKDLYRLAFQYDLQLGILLFVIGLIILQKPNNVMHFICIAIGIAIIAECLFKMQTAIDAKNFGVKTWWLILLLSALTGLAGLLLVFRPAESSHILMIFLGVSLLAEGILNLSVAVSLVKIVKYQVPDIIEAECWEDRIDQI